MKFIYDIFLTNLNFTRKNITFYAKRIFMCIVMFSDFIKLFQNFLLSKNFPNFYFSFLFKCLAWVRTDAGHLAPSRDQNSARP